MIQRCSDAYWTVASDKTMQDYDRMEAVLKLVADEIESWSPDKTIAPIPFLQIREIALKLRLESVAHKDPKRQDDFIA